MIAGTAGYLLGGVLSDTLGRRGGGKIVLLSVLPIVALPGTLAVLMPDITTALIALAAIAVATPMVNVAMNATMQELLPNDMRGFSYSLLAVVSALPAGAGGPLIFALVTEHVLGDPARIGTSFMIVGVPSLLLSAGCFLFAYRTYRRSLVPS
jgi:MFS family permease